VFKITTKCYECGKKIRIWNSYHHPSLGKKIFVCSKCYDLIEESMEKYRDFILKEFNDKKKKKKINKYSYKIKKKQLIDDI
jgi:hypothetical protein